MLYRMLLLALIPVLAIYLYERIRHLRFRQNAAWPQLKPSLLWGHMKALHEFIVHGEPKRHIGIVLCPNTLELTGRVLTQD